MTEEEAVQKIKEVSKDAEAKLRQLHRDKITVLKTALEERAQERTKEIREQLSGEERATKVIATYKKGIETISSLKQEAVNVMKQADEEESTERTAAIKQSLS